MLQAQVNYWNLVETKRHNLATEDLGVKTLEYQYSDLAERHRHNITEEGTRISELNEATRHNKASEAIGWETLSETKRHNVATENLGMANLNETVRHNTTTEGIGMEQNRINWERAKMENSVNWANIGVAQANANTNRLNAVQNARKISYDNLNTQYSNRTARLNAYSNEKNATLRQLELVNKQRETNIKEAELPAKYLSIIGGSLK